MARNLLGILGLDPESSAVQAGRRHGSAIARLIDGLVSVREKHGLTQAEVAERMGTTQSSVSNFERQGGDPKLSTLLRYADAVGAELDLHVTDTAVGTTQTVVARPVEAGSAGRYRTAPFEIEFS